MVGQNICETADKIVSTAWLADVVEHWTAVWEVES